MSPSLEASTALLLPMKLDAFVFNSKVCSGHKNEAKIVPINQPNYTFLRLKGGYLQNDILSPADLYFSSPAACNSRFTDLGARKPLSNRQGVYLHWMVPRTYRTGTASQTQDSTGRGDMPKNQNPGKPLFLEPPLRWLVVRKINDMQAIEPKDAPVEEIRAWIVESDRKRTFNDLPSGTDIQVDVSPFIYAMEEDNDHHIDIEKQGEVFIGYKQDAFDAKHLPWAEDLNAARVQLNLLNTSNQLFADYQPHNNNVFSLLDNLEYLDPVDGTTKSLEKASVSYTVVGWHPAGKVDPFAFDKDSKEKRSDRLSSLSMVMAGLESNNVADWLAEVGNEHSATLCHGSIYEVEWTKSEKPTVTADRFAEKLAGDSPVAVGTTPIDALLAYVRAHEQTDAGLVQRIEQAIHALDSLLRARDDGVEAQRQAQDMLTNWNFERVEGGKRFFLAGTSDAPDARPTKPSNDERSDLMSINEKQILLDASQRLCRSLRWDMFSWWWTYLSDVKGADRASYIATQVAALRSKIEALETKITAMAGSLNQMKTKDTLKTAKDGVLLPFSQQRDPTLVIGAVKSGWPFDYLHPLRVRTEGQTFFDTSFQALIPNLPAPVQTAVQCLLKEFISLDPRSSKLQQSADMQAPLYHDLDLEGLRRDNWEGRQPWFPLYLEWEAEYTHIPFDDWTMENITTRTSDAAKLQYTVKEDKILEGPEARLEGRTSFTGRELILPQPSFSLKAKIEQLFAETPKSILREKLSAKDDDELAVKISEIQNGIQNLAFLSSPLSGFRDHLVTRVQGSHIKPNNRAPHGPPVPMKGAITASQAAGFDEKELRLIGLESDLTPYGTIVQAAKDGHTYFKPVTHGQFRFTKINIIDKFGQAIHAIEPTPLKRGPEPLYPCISDYYKPQQKSGSQEAHVIRPNGALNEYIQLPPQINQLARLNSTFVTLDTSPPASSHLPKWKPTNEWDNPIWGWVMVNYADQGVQIFLPDGTFYREVRFGGPKGTQTSAPWAPFAPPENLDDDASADVKQLQTLVERLQASPGYLHAFVDMSTKALKNSPASPSAYAEFMNAAIGKPMALVNVGWSIELATDALVNQAIFDQAALPKHLLPTSDQDGNAYRFPVKLGDKERLFDGLVGYFEAQQPPTSELPVDLDKLYTFFTEDSEGDDSALSVEHEDTEETPEPDPRESIDVSTFPLFTAFYINPLRETAESYTAKRDANLKIFSAIIDPFVPIHAYSSVLPINALTLPPWTWQEAMNRMTAFLHLGPLLVTKDVPAYNSEYRLKTGYNLGVEGKESTNPVQALYPEASIGIPAVEVADWAWLQAYWAKEDGPNDAVSPGETVYMPLRIEKTDTRPRYEPGPYTAVEGYLQMRRPIMGPNTAQ
ncbi:hypothetical protein CERZMDRAFT_109041 [Cercospora zeae-maydis SCOH1-5]|uniref:Uncharacterized protein n=1 Tax=Cercospora zeae-maydis SCOH1-5 TaxID=717836 RepID=A0A6A6FVL4_9PEZI|nr:hypothetical protein CERZMDRAFT_109041 [Cercospora zeae-maydis SCOH1-5]